jgi:ABC-type multidrug transport system fused ATPase/permease subunit
MANHYIILLMFWTGISRPQELTLLLAITFAMGVVLANIFRFLTLFSQQFLSATIAVDLGETLFLKTLYKPYNYFLNNSTSQFISNTTNDLSSALGTLSCFFSIITQGLIAIFVATGLLIYNPKIALILSAIILVSYSLIMSLVRHRLSRNGRILADRYEDMIGALQGGFGGIRHIILGGLQANYATRFREFHKHFRYKSAENTLIVQSPKFFLESIGVMAICIVTTSFTIEGKALSEIIPLMGFLVFGCYRLLPAIQNIYSAFGTILSLSTSVERVIRIIIEPLHHDQTKAISAPSGLKSSIEFRNVYFDYYETGENWTVRDLSLEIDAKTTVAFVGHTGSGKSTVSDLILGLISPQKGEIRVDDVPLNGTNMRAWQNGLSHVPQNIFLNDTTIIENIAFGVPVDQIDTDKVIRAAEQAQIHSFIQTLPNGYNEKVGERGIRLSGGERQRIGIARALYQNPSVIIFDEATSALDNKTEHNVVRSIACLKRTLTVILIAHRLSTVKNADKIFVISKGQLVAQGRYDELQENPYFKELVKSSELD